MSMILKLYFAPLKGGIAIGGAVGAALPGLAEILGRIQNSIAQYDLDQNLDREKVIRSFLYTFAQTFPEHNVAIYENSIALALNFTDTQFEREFKIRDIKANKPFVFTIIVFRRGTITIFHDLKNSERWGKTLDSGFFFL
jgi:hypothetical protein